jgi:hypothetical protein
MIKALSARGGENRPSYRLGYLVLPTILAFLVPCKYPLALAPNPSAARLFRMARPEK